MVKAVQIIHPIFFLIAATTLEVSGDAIVRMAIYDHAGFYRIALFAAARRCCLATARCSIWPHWNSARWSAFTSRHCSSFRKLSTLPSFERCPPCRP